jgi:hypothetical protein
MIHVAPLNDLFEHDLTETGNMCHCEPSIIMQPDSEIIVVHNSFDGREGVEWANEILNQSK